MDFEKLIAQVPGWMSPDDLQWLTNQAKTTNSWIEIGTYCGKSALCVGLNIRKNARLTIIDSKLGDHHEKGQSIWTTLKTLKQHRPDIRTQLIRAPSIEAAEMVTPAEVVFIDADHSYESCNNDIKAWKPLAKNIISGHDYSKNWPGVIQAVNENFQNPTEIHGSIWVIKNNPRTFFELC